MKTAKNLAQAAVCGGSRMESLKSDKKDRSKGAWWPLRVFAALALLAACATVGMAQVPTGSISGTVLDAQRLPIVDATVTLKNEQTNRTFTSKTGSAGGYQFERLDYGQYQVTVSKDGFKNGAVNNIKLDASTEYSVAPLLLEVGQITETVSVEAGPELVQTTSAQVSGTVEKQQIDELPILDRRAIALLGLEAGVAGTGASDLMPTTINGQRTSFSTMTLDGINIQDNFIRDNALDFTPNLPFSSQAQEFTVITQNADVDKGGGAIASEYS